MGKSGKMSLCEVLLFVKEGGRRDFVPHCFATLGTTSGASRLTKLCKHKTRKTNLTRGFLIVPQNSANTEQEKPILLTGVLVSQNSANTEQEIPILQALEERKDIAHT
jgi:hypothetical protein